MTLDPRLVETNRHTRRTLYVVTGLYVVVGFLIAAVAALEGDRLSAFLGFVIISGTLAAAVLVNAVLRVGSRLTTLVERIEQVHDRLGQLEESRVIHETRAAAASADETLNTLGLAGEQPIPPTVLTAANLDRSIFPRLVPTGDEQMAGGAANKTIAAPRRAASQLRGEPRVTSDRLWRKWETAVQAGDLAGGRALCSVLVDTVGPDAVATLTAEMDELTARTETSLRGQFSGYLQKRDYANALAIGAKITRLLPDRPIAAEFARVRPLLERHLGGPSTPYAKAGTDDR